MNPAKLLLEAKEVLDVEGLLHDANVCRNFGRERQMTEKQTVMFIAPLFFIGFQPSFLLLVLPKSSKTGKKALPGTHRNTMNTDINPVLRNMLGLPFSAKPKDIYRKGRERYYHGALQVIKGDALHFRERSNNGDFSRLKIRAFQFIKSIDPTVAQHKEKKDLLNLAQNSQFEALKRQGDQCVEKGDRLFNARGKYASAYSSAIERYHEALVINPLEQNLSDDESLWLRVVRCYIQLGFYRYAIIICDYALFNIFERDARKARAFYFLGYALDELTLQSQDFSGKNLDSVIYCCDRATHFNPNNLLPRWLKVEAYVRDFELNGGNQNRADRALADYIAALKDPMSQNSFKKYRAKLLQDAYDALSKPQWKKQFDEIRSVL
jgi:tetratricopeptide (TPR) repeat protein